MSETCNHVAAALFRVECAMRVGLTNPACTAKPCEWMPNRKEVQNKKVKDMCLGRETFDTRNSKRGKPKRKFMPTPKKIMILLNIVKVLNQSVYKMLPKHLRMSYHQVCFILQYLNRKWIS